MKTSQIAAQLYTCRDLLKTPADIVATLRRLRDIGYKAVQICELGPLSVGEWNKALHDEGLVCCATHEHPTEILNDPKSVLEKLNKLQCNFTAYPYPLNVDFGSQAIVVEFVRKLEISGEVLAAGGVSLCYHNHNHELRRFGERTILDFIYVETSARHLQAELDTFWIHYGGGDNVEWCEKLMGRLPLIHLKDYMTNSENLHAYCEIGSGNLNFGRIISAAEVSGCQWFIVEQDTCPGDPINSLAQSYRCLAELSTN